MELREHRCGTCLSFGYCYFPHDCGRDADPTATLSTGTECLNRHERTT